MKSILEDLKYQLEHEEKHITYLSNKMQDDIKTRDYDHLCRLAAEANESKGKIEILTRTIYMIEKANEI